MADSHPEERRKLLVQLKLPAAYPQLFPHRQCSLPLQRDSTTDVQQATSDLNALITPPIAPGNTATDSPQSLLITYPTSRTKQDLPSNRASEASTQAHLDSFRSKIAPALQIASLLIAPQDDATTIAGASVQESGQETDRPRPDDAYSEPVSREPESECIRVSKPRPFGEDAPRLQAETDPPHAKRVSISISELLRPASEEPVVHGVVDQMIPTDADASPMEEATCTTSAPPEAMPRDAVLSSNAPIMSTAELSPSHLDADMQDPVPEMDATATAIAIAPHTSQTAHVTLKLSPAGMAKLATRIAPSRSARDYGRDRNVRRAATKAFGVARTPGDAAHTAKVPRQPTKAKVTVSKARSNKRGAQDNVTPAVVKRQKPYRILPNTRSSPEPEETLVLFPDPAAARRFERDLITGEPRPVRDVEGDSIYVQRMMEVLESQSTAKINDTCKEQSVTMRALLARAVFARDDEALYLTASEAKEHLAPGKFWNNVIVTAEQQPLPLQSIDDFLREFYEEEALVWIQDCSAKSSKQAPSIRQVPIKNVKQRFAARGHNPKPWNLLELATHHEDGLRPHFLNNEDCRLLTKLKIPDAADHTRRKTYPVGFKEVEKWALLAQAGALTLPHQDSHGYSTYITVNVGLVGFGWLSSPTPAKRVEWNKNTQKFIDGSWRYVVLKPGQTVYFPAGTVHFVFRLPSAGNTLAFGGHVLRCSNIVHWVRCLLEEVQSAGVTNEDLTDSATGYLDRVERYVKQARKTGDLERWGGEESISEFLKLKARFTNGKKQK